MPLPLPALGVIGCLASLNTKGAHPTHDFLVSFTPFGGDDVGGDADDIVRYWEYCGADIGVIGLIVDLEV